MFFGALSWFRSDCKNFRNTLYDCGSRNLRGGSSSPAGKWELLHEEDHDLLVPATLNALKELETVEPSNAAARRAFLRNEVASVFAQSDLKTLHRIGNLFYGGKAEDAEAVGALLEKALAPDDGRWLHIALALSAGTYTKNNWSLLTPLGEPTKSSDFKPTLQTLVVAHITPTGLDERIIRAVFAPGVPYEASAKMLQNNRLIDAPLTKELLIAALNKAEPNAIGIAFQLQAKRNKDDPIAIAAVAAALRIVSSDAEIEHDPFYFACHVIIEWGDEKDVLALFTYFQSLVPARAAKHQRIWNMLNWNKNPSIIRFISDMLNDTNLRETGDSKTVVQLIDAGTIIHTLRILSHSMRADS